MSITSHTSAATPDAVPARQGPPAGQGDAAQQQVAWQREMERAQMATWFKPPVATGKGSAAGPPGRAFETPVRNGMNDAAKASGALVGSSPGAVAPLPAMPLEPLAAGLRIGVVDVFEGAAQVPLATARFFTELRPAVVAQAPPETRVPVEVQMRCGTSLLPTAGESVAGSAPDAEAEAVAESRAAQPSSTPDVQAPLRLHEESMSEGQAVWIAMRADDDVLAAMLPRIVADLQRGVPDRGQRLHQVVCNGRLIWRDDVEVPMAGDASIPGGASHPTTVDSFHSKGA